MSEHSEQVALFQWAEITKHQYPELALLHAIPNGGNTNAARGRWLKAEGLKAGVPDIMLPVARCGWHGLYIELKFDKNKPTKKQKQWLDALTEQGYLATACWGMDEAQALIESYLEDNK